MKEVVEGVGWVGFRLEAHTRASGFPAPGSGSPDRGSPLCSARQSSGIQTIKDMVDTVFDSGLTIIEKKY